MNKKLTYRDAGVDIDKADLFIKNIVPLIKTTKRSEVIGSIGSFSGFFRPSFKDMQDPVLVAATDGVGTKLLVANAVNKHDTIGIDLVAMCVNDIITCGAEPLFFLDYFATGAIEPAQATDIMKGITKGCRQSNCALIGGETAEMPGMYEKGHYDLAGFCVGMVDKTSALTGEKVIPGDTILGLASNGLHSNGYSLARKAFTEEELQGPAGKALLKPTKIYVKPLLELHKRGLLKAAAHITGGGLPENLPRCLPEKCQALIRKKAWKIPSIFKEIQKRGNIEEKEMFRTFNMGIGMTLVLDPGSIDEARDILKEHDVRCSVIGELVKGTSGEVLFE